jgi:hypothetical protein
MFEDPFYHTHQGEVFYKSDCMQHERTLTDFFCNCLTNLGYYTSDKSRRIWKRKDKTVIVCLADDFSVCGGRLDLGASFCFDDHAVIITDNHITVPTQYWVCQLPVSYFGIFGYVPDNQLYTPEKRFNFSVNRLDTQRQLILLNLIFQSGNIHQVLDLDFINFNCWDADGANNTHSDIKNNFCKYWDQLKNSYSKDYQPIVDQLIDQLPLRNHNFSIEDANLKSWLTPVVETYSGNTTMAFSEKIFRALQTPMPWTLYSATGAVDYLHRIGFDVLNDLIDHSYNTVIQDSPHGVDKISKFIQASIHNVVCLQNINLAQVQTRCKQAASHNQQHLAQLRQQWPVDFAQWLPATIEKII